MGTPRFTPEFKEEAVRQITERGYSVAEVSDHLGVSTHSLYKWLRAIKPDSSEQHARDLLEAKSEILKLRAQLKRTEEERDILKKAARYFAREPEVPLYQRAPHCMGCDDDVSGTECRPGRVLCVAAQPGLGT